VFLVIYIAQFNIAYVLKCVHGLKSCISWFCILRHFVTYLVLIY